jgi:hypothetical protein
MKSIMLALVIQLLCSITLAQHPDNENEKLRLVEIPRDEVLMVVVNQPDCPLKIEDVSFLIRLDNGKMVQKYRVRNISTKSIATFTINSWSMTGSGGTLPVTLTTAGRPLDPAEMLDSFQSKRYEILPLTAELRQELKRRFDMPIVGKMQNVFFLMVDTVRFEDGSVYNDRVLKESLGEYLSEHYRYPEK